MQKYLLMLYQGLKVNRFYWELINTARKAMLLCLPAFMSTASLNYKVLSATSIMIVILRVQNDLEPYKDDSHNKLEFNEIITGAFTIYATLIFQNDEKNNSQIDLMIFLIGESYPINTIFSDYCQCKISAIMATLYSQDTKIPISPKHFKNYRNDIIYKSS